MIFVEVEAKGAEGSIHAVQAVHVAFTAVGISMELALNEEACLEERAQPWRPLALHLLLTFLFHWPSSSLQFHQYPQNKTRSNHRIQQKQGNVAVGINQLINLTMILLFLGFISIASLEMEENENEEYRERKRERERRRLSFLEREQKGGGRRWRGGLCSGGWWMGWDWFGLVCAYLHKSLQPNLPPSPNQQRERERDAFFSRK